MIRVRLRIVNTHRVAQRVLVQQAIPSRSHTRPSIACALQCFPGLPSVSQSSHESRAAFRARKLGSPSGVAFAYSPPFWCGSPSRRRTKRSTPLKNESITARQERAPPCPPLRHPAGMARLSSRLSSGRCYLTVRRVHDDALCRRVSFSAGWPSIFTQAPVRASQIPIKSGVRAS